eukprot:TRINITY_DN3632_c0_g2_i2.p1 TRINITY_DN3632_c0_g2~~TRINITY_DN3632_c0_g2_i2.p1  ORF type:complete len:639 (+),score=195.48 TRINITY_DN3632_c0_g2_i2:54-1970(+)
MMEEAARFDKLEDQICKSLKDRFSLADQLADLEKRDLELRTQLRDVMNQVKNQGNSDPNSKETEILLEVALFLASANAALRSSLSHLYDRRRELMIASGELPSAENDALKNMFSTRIFNQPMLFGSEIPFEMCTEGPKALCEDWNARINLHGVPQAAFIPKVSTSLEANLQIFAHAKAFRGSTRDADGADKGPGGGLESKDDLDVGSHGDLGYGFFGERPYPFEDDFSENMILSETGAIKCATLDKLIERMTSEQVQDLNLRYVFILTYHSFSNENEVLNKLVERFQIPPPPNITPEEYEFFQTAKEKPIRLKVFGVLNFWIKEHYADFENNNELKKKVMDLLAGAFSDLPWCDKVAKTVVSTLQKEEAKVTRRKKNEFTFPKFFDDKAEMRSLEEGFMEADEEKIAQQITWKDFEVFRRIHPRECLNQRWSKTNKAQLAPNVVATIDRFNRINNWTQKFILSYESEKARIAAMAKVIRIAEYFQQYNNFNSVAAIFFALESNAIHRLKKTWEGLPAKQKSVWDELQRTLFSSKHNRKNLRKAMDTGVPPCILYLGVFTADLTFIEDGNPDTLKGMINWFKRCKLAERIQRIKQCQQSPYSFTPIPLYQKYFQSKLVVSVDEEEFWKMSLALEPQPKN